MKTTIYNVIWTSYTENDNYLYNDVKTFTSEKDAFDFFNDLRGKARSECLWGSLWDADATEREGQESYAVNEEYSCEADKPFGKVNARGYRASSNAYDGYRVEVKMQRVEIDVPMPQEVEVLYAVDTDDNTKTALLAMTADEWKQDDKAEAIERELREMMGAHGWNDYDDQDELLADIREAAGNLSAGLPTDALEDYDYELFFETVKMV